MKQLTKKWNWNNSSQGDRLNNG